jgi:hypothetical protein
MDVATFVYLAILIFPIYITIWMILIWFKSKFDKYEEVALNILKFHTDKKEAVDEVTELYQDIYKKNINESKRSIVEGIVLLTTTKIDEKIQSNPNAKLWSQWVEERVGKGLLGLQTERTFGGEIAQKMENYPVTAAVLDLASAALHHYKQPDLS